MTPSGLTALQERVLAVLAGLEPPWTLTGGAALVGMYGVERATRDLDLFFHGLERLGDLPDEVARRLRSAGFAVAALQSAVALRSFRVSDGSSTVVVDLVADPVPSIEGPQQLVWNGVVILVDTPHEILVNKLCSLLQRSELRDLSDIRDLIEAGGNLERALADAPRKDGGFSPLTLAWVLRELALEPLALVSGLDPASIARLKVFRDELEARVTALARPT